MSVYIDNARIPLGRMLMCHMLADTREELDAMAKKIGLPKTAKLQNEGQPNEHFDVSGTYRDKAIKAGAKAITSRELVKIIRAKRLSPEEAEEEVALEAPSAPEDDAGDTDLAVLSQEDVDDFMETLEDAESKAPNVRINRSDADD